MATTITNLRKLFCYGVKRDHYEKNIGTREFSERLALDCFNNTFSADTETPEKNIPPIDEVDDGETVYTCRALNFYSSTSISTEVRNI